MIADGLVTRAVESRDARRATIRITSAGRKAATRAVPRLVEPMERAFSGLSAQEFSMLDQLLRKAIVSFDASTKPLRAAA